MITTNKRNLKTAPTPPFLLGSVSPPMFLPPLSDSWGTGNGCCTRGDSWGWSCTGLGAGLNFVSPFQTHHTLSCCSFLLTLSLLQLGIHHMRSQVLRILRIFSMGPSHRLHFFTIFSRVGRFHKMQPFRSRLSSVSPLRETAPAWVPLSVGPQAPQDTVDPFVCQGTLLSHI